MRRLALPILCETAYSETRESIRTILRRHWRNCIGR